MRGGFEIVYEITLTTQDIKRIVFAVSLMTLILVSVLTVFADNNTTNNTTGPSLNNSNVTVEPMSARASVTVSPSTVNLGTVMPDGSLHSYPGIATVTVTDWGLIFDTDLYVRASGAFVNTADPSSTIPLSNFQYDNPTTGSRTSFTTSNELVKTWTSFLIMQRTVSMNYYLTVPTFTTNGTYTTTIMYSVT